MSKQPMAVSDEDFKKVEAAIDDVVEEGKNIRTIFENYYDSEIDISWEVDASVDAFSIFSSRWTIEILATLYIAGERRFNEMRKLLRGISSRTLSDKLTKCTETGLVRGSWRTVPRSGSPTASLTTGGRLEGS